MNEPMAESLGTGPARGSARTLSMGLALLAVVGCGNLTAGGGGEAEVVVSGNGTDGTGTASTSGPAFAMVPASGDEGDPAVEGDVTVALRVFLLAPDGGAEEISGGPREVTVDVHGEFPETLGSVPVTGGGYTGVRIVFSEVEANVTGLLDPGLLPVVTVDFEGEEVLVVERPLSVALDGRTGLVLTVHLRSLVWLALVDPETLLVPANGFRAAVEISGELVAR